MGLQNDVIPFVYCMRNPYSFSRNKRFLLLLVCHTKMVLRVPFCEALAAGCKSAYLWFASTNKGTTGIFKKKLLIKRKGTILFLLQLVTSQPWVYRGGWGGQRLTVLTVTCSPSRGSQIEPLSAPAAGKALAAWPHKKKAADLAHAHTELLQRPSPTPCPQRADNYPFFSMSWAGRAGSLRAGSNHQCCLNQLGLIL